MLSCVCYTLQGLSDGINISIERERTVKFMGVKLLTQDHITG